MTFKFIRLEKQNAVYALILNRPEKRNAFHAEMILEITKAAEMVAKDSNARVLLIKGDGPSFCSGADLDWMRSMKDFSFEQNLSDSRNLFRMFEAIYDLDIPVIARVQGHAMGGALGLISVCDIVGAETQTQFCFSEVKWGLVPAVISPFAIRKMTKSFADQLMLTAKVFHSDEALSCGLIQFKGTLTEVDEFISDQLKLLTQAAPIAVRETKNLLKKIEGFDPKKHLALTTKVISERRTSEEGQKGLGFFINKEKPVWT